ncbi:MAG: O-antigen ligase family protein [Planctomycetota bacterium]|nr:O-antigen ligase family protein [Planctomycetota bacterium]
MKTVTGMIETRNEFTPDAAVLGLCVFSVVNPLIAQAAFFLFPRPIGGMNIMQWFQGLCFPLILAMLLRLPAGCITFSRPFSRLLLMYIVAFGLLHLRLVSGGRMAAETASTERMVYFKIIFALLLWYSASRIVQSYESARRLLQWILLGALLSAIWVLVCYFASMGGAHYVSVGVKATAGSEGVSGKGVSGFLLPAAGAAVYLALHEGSCRWAVWAALLLAAVFVTFDRSAQVAFAAGLSWIAVWWLLLARPRPSVRSLLPLMCIAIVLGATYYAHYGSEELIARWTHDFDRGEVGSGRGTFYATAWNWFWKDSSLMDFLFGMGYGNIQPLMLTGSGAFRHTHSDLFDMLLIGGMAGLALYLLLLYTIVALGKDMAVGGLPFACLGALVISFGTMSLLTGLMAFPHTVYAFGAQCICIRVLAIRGAEQPRAAVVVGGPGCLWEYPHRKRQIRTHQRCTVPGCEPEDAAARQTGWGNE